MKEHVQDYGVRKWAGDDLIELQAEPLSALQALVAPYAPCILTGCELETVPDGNGDYRLHAGYVALKGRKTVDNGAGTDTDTGAEGTENGSDAGVATTAENGDTTAAQDEEYVKIVRVTAQTVKQPTVFLTLACTPISRAYGNGENKAIAYDYTAEVCDVLSKVGDRPYLTLVADAENPRLPDTLGITKKLNRVDGEAQDTVVKFTETFTETDSVPDRPELKSGSRLGLLMRQIRKWFDELKNLKDLAFKDKVAKTDLDADLQGELDGKVTQEEGMGLSEANFTTEEKLKLEDIDEGANYFTYTHPTSAGNKHIPSGGSSGQYLKYSAAGTATWASPSNNTATSSNSGFMSASDKGKLDGIATGANKTTVDASLSSSSTNPVQNKVVYSALAGKAESTHGHTWSSIIGRPSTFTPASHSHSWDSITGKPYLPHIICAGVMQGNSFHCEIGNATATYGGSGYYQITIDELYVKGVAIVTPYSGGYNGDHRLFEKTVTIRTRNSAGTMSDTNFYFMFLGW